jgi:ribonuclease Z
MNAVTFLGTGPGDVVAGRGQAALLLEMGGSRILLDAGEPCAGRLVDLGVSLDELDAVAITHAHADHIGGLPLLLQATWLHGRTRPLPVIVPVHLRGPLTAWLEAIFLGPAVLKFALEFSTWTAGEPLAVGGVTVTPQPTSHLDRIRVALANPDVASYALDLRTADRRFVYTGDLGGAGDLAPLVAEPADVLVCELAHLTVDELIAVLRGAQVQTLCLTHLARAVDDGQRETIRLRCERELPGVVDVFVPDDGEMIEF